MAYLGKPAYTIAVLQKYNFNFRKQYGQNFLIDEGVLEDIIDKSGITEDDCVLEIGPGIGTLTQYLAEKSRHVVAVEIDKALIPILADTLSDYDNVTVINDDILKVDITRIVGEYNSGKPIKVVANLPYYITTPIINKIINEKLDVKQMILMVQKEVGERFSAKPNTKDYSSITVFLNYYYEIRKEFLVSRNCFYPQPNVDSVIISFTRKEKKLKVNNEDKFFKLIRDSFVQKRKTLRNNLKEYDFNKIESILESRGFQKDVRAEALPLELFVEISNNLGIK
jgi:16S rRNA (adenine1518-N6/adenine1519-N6)-dimethyltransferase